MEWTLPIVEFNYNWSINEASKHYLFEVSYGFQPASPFDRFLPSAGAPASVAKRLTELANARKVLFVSFSYFLSIEWLLVLLDQRLLSLWMILFFLSSKGLHIHSQKYKYLRDQRLGPFQVIEKVFRSLFDLNYLKDVDFIRCFIVVSFPKHLILHLCAIDLLKSKVTIMNMQLISYRMLMLINGQIVVVFIFNS